MTDTEKQILSILEGSTTQYISEKTEKSILTQADFRDAYSISVDDIIAYVKGNGLPLNSCNQRPSLKDGMYFLEAYDNFTVYYQEKGCKFNSKTFSSMDEAIEYLIREKVYHSGVILK